MDIILKNGEYAGGDFLPEGAIEVARRPRNEAIWADDTWTFPAGLAMSDLRKQRNNLLLETDWWASSDLTMSKEQKDYRKTLRDFPSTASPKLDENGQLTGATWPTKPE